MKRYLSLTLVALLAGCASSSGIVQPESVAFAFEDLEPLGRSTAITSTTSTTTAPRRDGNWVGTSYTKLKLGAFEPDGDFSAFDSGLAAEVVFGREILAILSIEGSLGYVDGSGPAGSDYYAIPMFVQARASLPILIFEPYAGVGLGAVYADVSGTGPGTGDDFVGAATAFIGVEVGLGQIALGLEGKYIESDEINSGPTLKGTSIMLTGTLPF